MRFSVSILCLFLVLSLAIAVGQPSSEEKQITGLDIQVLRDALERFYLDYDTLTTIENLDDAFSTTSTPAWQRINDGGGAIQVNPSVGKPFRETLIPAHAGAGPPYVGYSSARQYEGPDGDYDEGTPLDGWGNPYYLYSPLGLIEPSSVSLSQRFYGDEFDFYTLVSHGPDGEMGGGDDYFAQIFLQVTRTTVSSARASFSAAKSAGGWEIGIKGYSLGSQPGDVLLDGAALDGNLLEWSPTLVRFAPYNLPAKGAPLSVRTSTGVETGEVPLIYQEEPLFAGSWSFYQ